MTSKNLLNKFAPVKKALGDFNMIAHKERVAVGISGGKDSLTCLFALKTLVEVLPIKYQLVAIAVDLQNSSNPIATSYNEISKFCKQNDIEFYVETTNIFEVVFDIRKESNPCSLCSRMRNGALVKRAKKENCYKIAIGHHLDDLVETTLMSMFFSGKMDSFYPKVFLDRQEVTFIRPLIYMREKDISSIAASYNLPISHDISCPSEGDTKRSYIKQLLQEQESYDKEIPIRIFSAIKKNIWESEN